MARNSQLLSGSELLKAIPLIRASHKIKLILLFVFWLAIPTEATTPEPEQTIDGFSLSGFGQAGERAWEIRGETADIFPDQIRLNNFTGTVYDKEKITVTAKRGNYNKVKNRVRLEDDVVITTESGAELTTDYLDWDRETQEVRTEAPVDINRDNMFLSGIGIIGRTNLSNVNLKKDILLRVNDEERKIVVTCSGPLSINYADNIAVFHKDVLVNDSQSQIYADLMEVFFTISESDSQSDFFAGKTSTIRKIIARGNVKIVRQGNVSHSNEAVYNAQAKTLTLTGRPKLVIYSTEEMDASFGN